MALYTFIGKGINVFSSHGFDLSVNLSDNGENVMGHFYYQYFFSCLFIITQKIYFEISS